MHRYLVAAALLAFIRSAGYALVAWRLVDSRTRWTPRVAIIGLWLIGPGLAWLTGSGVYRVLLPAIGYAAVWTAYLLRSDRVANTYRQPDDDLLDVFG